MCDYELEFLLDVKENILNVCFITKHVFQNVKWSYFRTVVHKDIFNFLFFSRVGHKIDI